MAYVRRMEQSLAVGQRDKYQLSLEKTDSVTCITKDLAVKLWKGVRQKKSEHNIKQTKNGHLTPINLLLGQSLDAFVLISVLYNF